MNAKRFTLSLVIVVCFVLSGSGSAKHKKSQSATNSASKANFDYYLLTLSWAPEFCATTPKAKGTQECDKKNQMGLVVHGLWPQYDNGKWPEECANTPQVPSDLVEHMLPIMPGEQLIQHEWAKHGTCSGLSMHDYFGAIEKLYDGLQMPADFKKPTKTTQSAPTSIVAKFASANDALKEAFRVSCPKSEFSAVQVCLGKDLKYMACPDTVKECRASKIKVRPVP